MTLTTRLGRGLERKTFIKAHLGEIPEADFFTIEVLTLVGLVCYYVFFLIDIQTRKVNIAGISHQPHGRWMEQVARNLTDAEEGFLDGIGSASGVRSSRNTNPQPHAPAAPPPLAQP